MKGKFTKIMAALALLVFMMPSLVAWGQTRTEVTYDFSEIDGFDNWGTGYEQHVVVYDAATVTFASANRQTSTITDIPVTKGQPVSLVLNNLSNQITSATFVCRQWGSKAQTITLHYSTNGGNNYTSTTITSTNFTISSNSLPEGTNAVKITFSSSSNQVGIESATINIATSSATATSVTISVPDDFITDVHEQTTNAGTLTATVSANQPISGATVTWSSSNENVATIDEDGVVTLVAAGNTTITASYAGETGVYAPSSATYELEVTDSTPFAGGDVTFKASEDKDLNNTTQGEGSITKNGVTFACSDGILGNGSEYRLYKNSTTTFSATEGTITQIVFTQSGNYAISNLTPDVGNLSEGTWTGNASTVSFTAGAQARATQIVVTVDMSGTPNPVITADNVSIEFGATQGEITYAIANPVDGASLGAVVVAGATISNFELGTIGASPITFTCDPNNTTTARTATVTLNYVKNGETLATKDVTITQAGNPDAIVDISCINAAGNYTVQGTIVAISNRGFVLGDGTGYVYYYKGSGFVASDYAIGDMKKLSGAVSASSSYKVYQFGDDTEITTATSSNYEAEDPTIISGSEMDARVGASTCTLSSFIQYEGVMTVSGNYYNITDISGAQTAKGSISYPLNTDFTSLNGKQVKVTGYYVGVSSDQYYNTMIGSIEEVVIPVIIASNVTLEYDATEGEIEYEINNPTGATLTATTDSEWLSVGTVSNTAVALSCSANEGNADRTATVILSYAGAADKAVTVTQNHFIADYATLPFTFDGGRSDIENIDGLTQDGLDSDYGSSPKLKFNSTGDYVILRINERPGTLSFDIKGNSFSGSTFKVQTSEDGENYTDLNSYTGLTATVQSESFSNLGNNVRYIRWIYTEKSSGNVALGNIQLTEPYTLYIPGYNDATNPNGGYYLIASPVTVNPEDVEGIPEFYEGDPQGMTDGNFDLYYFDQAEEDEWRNYETQSFNLVPGKGYLYAHDTDVALTFTGTPYNGNGVFQLSYTEGASLAGWNLMGNPYNYNVTVDKDFYIMNEDGDEIITPEGTMPIFPMQGFFVVVTAAGQTVTFSEYETPVVPLDELVMNLSQNRGTVIDRAIVRFGEGEQLPKFQLFESSTKLYIPQGNSDYAIVRSAAEGEMPVNFKVRENGTYTISVNTENVEMDYLHLIDNMTGTDVDLLQTPSYTFEATTRDYASRFRLVFNTNGNNAEGNANFAYFNGSEWQISNIGEATLQVVDVMGRIVKNVALEGNATVSINEMPGVYMMRLLNGNDVKVQKVIIK